MHGRDVTLVEISDRLRRLFAKARALRRRRGRRRVVRCEQLELPLFR